MFKIKQNCEAWISVTMPEGYGNSVLKLNVKLISLTVYADKKYQNLKHVRDDLRRDIESGAIATIEAFMDKLSSHVSQNSPEAVEKIINDITERVIDWKDVTDEDGQPLPFDQGTFRSFLNSYSAIARKINAALESLDTDGRVKN